MLANHVVLYQYEKGDVLVHCGMVEVNYILLASTLLLNHNSLVCHVDKVSVKNICDRNVVR